MNPSQPRNAVVLVLDHLGANRLGPYGNTCYETHNFSRLAARSLLFDQAMTRSTDLERAYQGIWQGDGEGGKHLIERMGESGVRTMLMTDEPVIEDLELADAFDQVMPIESQRSRQIADSVSETELAGFFAQATEWLSSREPASLGWLHSRGLSGAWDAPYELRQRLADSDDPDPPCFWQPPACRFNPAVDDPDVLLGYQQASAAQVVLIDDFLGVILDLMDTDPSWQSTLFCVFSTRGFPLGEHQLVGSVDQDAGFDGSGASPYNESVHVPMLVCLPQSFGATGVRNGSLIQPEWVSGLLVDWFANSQEGFDRRWKSVSHTLPDKRHEYTISIVGEGQAIQTHAWKLIRQGSRCELYVKPDDLWEVNDVSRRCPWIVTQLGEILDRCIEGTMGERVELTEELSVRLG